MVDSCFGWYERVRIESNDPAKARINGQLGSIVGKVQSEEGEWSYGVFVYAEKLVWSCMENELSATGEFDSREVLYNGESVRVSQSGELLE